MAFPALNGTYATQNGKRLVVVGWTDGGEPITTAGVLDPQDGTIVVTHPVGKQPIVESIEPVDNLSVVEAVWRPSGVLPPDDVAAPPQIIDED